MINRRKRGCFGRFFRLVLYVMVAWVVVTLVAGLLPVSPTGGSTEGLSVNEDLPGDWINILLMGSDTGDTGANGRTDTMLIASIHRSSGKIKLTSIMRDTYLNVPGYGKQKINSANRFGGAELAMRTVNEAFGMNITQYALMDFASFPYLVECVGGVYLDISEEEKTALNRLVLSMRHLFKNTGVDTSELAAPAGERVRLTGLQTLAYSRIRKLDSDFMRTSRQRKVLEALLSRARAQKNPVTLYKLVSAVMKHAKTNLSLTQVISLGVKAAMGGGSVEQTRLPVDGAYTSGEGEGGWTIKPNLEKNREALRAFIYGT